MITSCPRAIRSVPRVSELNMALPPGLSVMLRAWTRGSRAKPRASSRTRRPLRSVMTPREVTSSTQVTKVSVSLSKCASGCLTQELPEGLESRADGFMATPPSGRWFLEAWA